MENRGTRIATIIGTIIVMGMTIVLNKVLNTFIVIAIVSVFTTFLIFSYLKWNKHELNKRFIIEGMLIIIIIDIGFQIGSILLENNMNIWLVRIVFVILFLGYFMLVAKIKNYDIQTINRNSDKIDYSNENLRKMYAEQKREKQAQAKKQSKNQITEKKINYIL